MILNDNTMRGAFVALNTVFNKAFQETENQ